MKIKKSDIEHPGADLTYSELRDLALSIQDVIVGNRAMTIHDYAEVAKEVSLSKLGYRKARALTHEPYLSIYFPDKVMKILSNRKLENIRFIEEDDKYFMANKHRGVQWLARHFYTTSRVIRTKANRSKVKLDD